MPGGSDWFGSDLSSRSRALLAGHQAFGRDRFEAVRREYVAGFLDRRALPLLDELRGEPTLAVSVLITALTDDEESGAAWASNRIAERIVRWKLPYYADDAELLVGLVETSTDHSWHRRTRARAALAALESLADAGEDLSALGDRLLAASLEPHEAEASEWTKLALRVRRLRGQDTGAHAAIDLSALAADDPWSEQVRPLLREHFPDQGGLLELLATATQSKPSARWRKAVEPLLGEDGAAMLRLLLESAVDVESRETGRFVYSGREYVHQLWLTDPSVTIVRGALWAASLLRDADWVASSCEELVARAKREEQLKVGNAVFYCLGERADDEAVAVLSRAVAQLKDRRFLKPAQRALEVAAEKRGLTAEQLREQLVPTFGLDAEGHGERSVGPATTRVDLAPPANVKLRYLLAGKESAAVPQTVKEDHPAELAALKAEVAELRKELSVQRLRLENLLAAGRVWSYDDWRTHYRDHPIVQLFARRLIWRFDGEAAMPFSRDELLTIDGSREPATGGEVTLWHPLEANTEEISAWRTILREREIRQPFRQAYREIYLLAPAERQTRLYSNRFAAHIVRYAQVYALAKQRGWGIRALGWFDNDGGEQWRDFPEQSLRSSFWMQLADAEPGGGAIAELAATDQVRFSRIGERDPIELADVPPVVFSEAMRDVDLFVGVASIAADPTWLDGGVDRFNAYWHSHAFGELGESATVRREVLGGLLPGLKIADRLELEERYLRVRGNLHTYRIHVGSANILVEPDDRYLCIVPDRRLPTERVFLPFEDERLSVILSKALLLAADDRITDPAITQQLS